MTSRWIQSAPARSTARTSSASFAKSEARIDGAITSGRVIGPHGRLKLRLTRSAGRFNVCRDPPPTDVARPVNFARAAPLAGLIGNQHDKKCLIFQGSGRGTRLAD